MIKTLTQLKRDARNGGLFLELVERYGSAENIRENMKGKREVIGANTVAIFLKNTDGLKSELRFDSAKLIEYTEETLTVYEAGERDLTADERAFLDEWERIEREYIEQNPYSDTYWKKKFHFEKSPFQYLNGWDKVRGKRFKLYENKVVDDSIKGAAILRYKVHFA